MHRQLMNNPRCISHMCMILRRCVAVVLFREICVALCSTIVTGTYSTFNTPDIALTETGRVLFTVPTAAACVHVVMKQAHHTLRLLIMPQVAAVQHDIIADHAHLQDAAIPLQDLHLTLFVATLGEEDGSLKVQQFDAY